MSSSEIEKVRAVRIVLSTIHRAHDDIIVDPFEAIDDWQTVIYHRSSRHSVEDNLADLRVPS